MVACLRRYSALSSFRRHVRVLIAVRDLTQPNSERTSVAWFSDIDTAQKGMVGFSDFKAALPTLSHEEARSIFDSIDVAHEGLISVSEFHAATAVGMRRLSAEELLAALLMMGGKQGKLVYGTFRKVLNKQLPEMSEDEVKELFNTLDTDGDGVIDLEEFGAFVQVEETSQFI